jgi:hypothetical protein
MDEARDFEQLAQAMLYQRQPRLRRGDSKRARASSLPSFPLEDSSPTAEFSFRVERAPIMPLHVLSDDPTVELRTYRGAAADVRSSVSPMHTRGANVSNAKSARANENAAEPAAFLRRVAYAPRSVSSLLFFVMVALAVVTVAVVALAIAVPSSEWAFSQN